VSTKLFCITLCSFPVILVSVQIFAFTFLFPTSWDSEYGVESNFEQCSFHWLIFFTGNRSFYLKSVLQKDTYRFETLNFEVVDNCATVGINMTRIPLSRPEIEPKQRYFLLPYYSLDFHVWFHPIVSIFSISWLIA